MLDCNCWLQVIEPRRQTASPWTHFHKKASSSTTTPASGTSRSSLEPSSFCAASADSLAGDVPGGQRYSSGEMVIQKRKSSETVLLRMSSPRLLASEDSQPLLEIKTPISRSRRRPSRKLYKTEDLFAQDRSRVDLITCDERLLTSKGKGGLRKRMNSF